jgi:hypothetical protein
VVEDVDLGDKGGGFFGGVGLGVRGNVTSTDILDGLIPAKGVISRMVIQSRCLYSLECKADDITGYTNLNLFIMHFN